MGKQETQGPPQKLQGLHLVGTENYKVQELCTVLGGWGCSAFGCLRGLRTPKSSKGQGLGELRPHGQALCLVSWAIIASLGLQ